MVPLMRVAALVLAAGRGERLGADRPKAFVPVAGRALLVHSLAAVAAAQEIDQVIPVLGRNDARAWDELARELDSIVTVIRERLLELIIWAFHDHDMIFGVVHWELDLVICVAEVAQTSGR